MSTNITSRHIPLSREEGWVLTVEHIELLEFHFNISGDFLALGVMQDWNVH